MKSAQNGNGPGPLGVIITGAPLNPEHWWVS